MSRKPPQSVARQPFGGVALLFGGLGLLFSAWGLYAGITTLGVHHGAVYVIIGALMVGTVSLVIFLAGLASTYR